MGLPLIGVVVVERLVISAAALQKDSTLGTVVAASTHECGSRCYEIEGEGRDSGGYAESGMWVEDVGVWRYGLLVVSSSSHESIWEERCKYGGKGLVAAEERIERLKN